MTIQLPPGVTLDRGSGNLGRLRIDTPAARAEIYLHGAHLTHWQPAGHKPVIWMSRQSQFAPGKAIRGGVPICFPWFGPKADDAAAPIHGLARLHTWTIESVTRNAAGVVTATLRLTSQVAPQGPWPGEFVLRHRVIAGPTLTLELLLESGATAISAEEAFHTYFAVGDVRQVQVSGLAGATYIDKADGFKRKTQGGEPITIAAETDRAFFGTTTASLLHDPVLRRNIRIEKSGSRTTVVWNPWIAKAKAMPDFGDDEWPQMICIETANAKEDQVKLPPHAQHTMRAVISVEEA
jgi:glucose-6-phosphate 1-epimerase